MKVIYNVDRPDFNSSSELTKTMVKIRNIAEQNFYVRQNLGNLRINNKTSKSIREKREILRSDESYPFTIVNSSSKKDKNFYSSDNLASSKTLPTTHSTYSKNFKNLETNKYQQKVKTQEILADFLDINIPSSMNIGSFHSHFKIKKNRTRLENLSTGKKEINLFQTHSYFIETNDHHKYLRRNSKSHKQRISENSCYLLINDFFSLNLRRNIFKTEAFIKYVKDFCEKRKITEIPLLDFYKIKELYSFSNSQIESVELALQVWNQIVNKIEENNDEKSYEEKELEVEDKEIKNEIYDKNDKNTFLQESKNKEPKKSRNFDKKHEKTNEFNIPNEINSKKEKKYFEQIDNKEKELYEDFSPSTSNLKSNINEKIKQEKYSNHLLSKNNAEENFKINTSHHKQHKSKVEINNTVESWENENKNENDKYIDNPIILEHKNENYFNNDHQNNKFSNKSQKIVQESNFKYQSKQDNKNYNALNQNESNYNENLTQKKENEKVSELPKNLNFLNITKDKPRESVNKIFDNTGFRIQENYVHSIEESENLNYSPENSEHEIENLGEDTELKNTNKTIFEKSTQKAKKNIPSKPNREIKMNDNNLKFPNNEGNKEIDFILSKNGNNEISNYQTESDNDDKELSYYEKNEGIVNEGNIVNNKKIMNGNISKQDNRQPNSEMNIETKSNFLNPEVFPSEFGNKNQNITKSKEKNNNDTSNNKKKSNLKKKDTVDEKINISDNKNSNISISDSENKKTEGIKNKISKAPASPSKNKRATESRRSSIRESIGSNTFRSRRSSAFSSSSNRGITPSNRDSSSTSIVNIVKVYKRRDKTKKETKNDGKKLTNAKFNVPKRQRKKETEEEVIGEEENDEFLKEEEKRIEKLKEKVVYAFRNSVHQHQRDINLQKITFQKIIQDLENFESMKTMKIDRIKQAIEDKILFLENYNDKVDDETRMNIIMYKKHQTELRQYLKKTEEQANDSIMFQRDCSEILALIKRERDHLDFKNPKKITLSFISDNILSDPRVAEINESRRMSIGFNEITLESVQALIREREARLYNFKLLTQEFQKIFSKHSKSTFITQEKLHTFVSKDLEKAYLPQRRKGNKLRTIISRQMTKIKAAFNKEPEIKTEENYHEKVFDGNSNQKLERLKELLLKAKLRKPLKFEKLLDRFNYSLDNNIKRKGLK